MGNIWNATEEQMLAANVLRQKIFEYIDENKAYLNERNTRQCLKSMFVSWVILVDTEPDKSDSDRLLYDMYNKVNEYQKCDFDDFETLLIRCLI